jgi:hypothetical protein
MDPFEYGDPYINWNEENDYKEEQVSMWSLEDLKSDVVKLLISEHDFLSEEAESAVEESLSQNEDAWNENAEAKDLAKFLASDGDDD